MIKSLFLVLITFVLFACNQEFKKNDLSFDSNKLRAEEQKYIQKMEKAQNKEIDYSNCFTAEELKQFLPESIEGYESLPHSIGKQTDDKGGLITFAKAQFQNEQRQNIVVDIFDYGKNNEIPNKDNYTNPPDDLDSPSIKYKDEFSEGFINLDKNLDFGRLEVLINNRFVLVVRLNKNINSPKQLIDILKKVKLEKLYKEK